MEKMPLPMETVPSAGRKSSLLAFRDYLQRPNIHSSLLNVLQTLAAVLISLAIGAGLLLLTGTNPFEAYAALFQGAFGSWPALARTLRTASPVVFTGLAVVVAFRAGYIYLGMEGSLYFGALGGALFGIYLTPFFPAFLHLPLSILAGSLAGGLWALFPAILRARWKVDEVVSTLMLNYVGILLVDHLVYTYFQDVRDGSSAERALTLAIPNSARLPFISERYGLTIAIVLGILLALFLGWMYARSVWGFEADMTGFNRKFAHYGGVNTVRMAIMSMVLSGVIAGLGGATESIGSYGRYIGGFSSDFGFSGVTVALMGRLNPIGTLFAAIFFGALSNGGASMELMVNVPRDMVVVVQGLILLVVTAQSLFTLLRLNPKARPEE
jgi:general nucleoside transport system permease protein